MVEIDPTQDYYQILGVGVDASAEQVRQSYRELAKLYHPDTGHGDVAKFLKIQEAYQVLYDTVYRKAYDRQRIARGFGGTGSLALTLTQSKKELYPLGEAQMLYVVAEIQPQDGLQAGRRELNLALVVDVSTSMHGVRMHNVKLAANDLIDSLGPSDRLAIVAFSDRAQVIKAGQLSEGKHTFQSAIAALTPGGGTEIFQGLSAGIGQVLPYVSPTTMSHVILLTDGRTYGDEEKALSAASVAAESGIGVSACGIGEDWNDHFLDDLARRGGGDSQYIDRPTKVQQVLQSRIKSLVNTAMRNVQFRASTSPHVDLLSAYRVMPYMEILQIRSGNRLTIGNLMTGEACVLALEFAIQLEETGQRRVARMVVEGDSLAGSRPLQLWRDLTVTVSRTIEEEPVPPRLLNILARLSVFRLQENAWNALAAGQPAQATRFLESAATHLFDLGYRELGQAAMLEAARLQQGHAPSLQGRKQLRYGTRSLTIPSS
jgi:Ca-activated chloride channel homolog